MHVASRWSPATTSLVVVILPQYALLPSHIRLGTNQVQNLEKLVKYKVEKEVNKGKNGQNEINKSFMYM